MFLLQSDILLPPNSEGHFVTLMTFLSDKYISVLPYLSQAVESDFLGKLKRRAHACIIFPDDVFTKLIGLSSFFQCLYSHPPFMYQCCYNVKIQRFFISAAWLASLRCMYQTAYLVQGTSRSWWGNYGKMGVGGKIGVYLEEKTLMLASSGDIFSDTVCYC